MENLLEVISALIYQKKYSEVKEILSAENAADLASLFEGLFGEDFDEQKEFIILFRLLPKDLAAETFVYMDSDMQEFLINAFSDGTFPQGFFTEVKKIETGKTATITIDDYIFLVQRIDVFDKTYGYYENNRTACLKAMKGDEFSKVIDNWSKNYIAE